MCVCARASARVEGGAEGRERVCRKDYEGVCVLLGIPGEMSACLSALEKEFPEGLASECARQIHVSYHVYILIAHDRSLGKIYLMLSHTAETDFKPIPGACFTKS